MCGAMGSFYRRVGAGCFFAAYLWVLDGHTGAFIVRRFIQIYVVTFFVVIISYGVIYFYLATGLFDNNGLCGIQQDAPIWIQTIYFSTATICTVGFGDINVSGPLAQLICTSEMTMGFILIVLF